MAEINNFDAVRISLASPEQIRSWSYGEVTKPETINYRTLKPEKDGLFCERIFGPTKDFECYCGKYKKARYRGVVCDKCGVRVESSKVRRERMGHIELAAPVAHIWFAKGIPSRLALFLDISPRTLELVLYFAQYIITSVNEEARQGKRQQIKEEIYQQIAEKEKILHEQIREINVENQPEQKQQALIEEINQLRRKFAEEKAQLEEGLQQELDKIEKLQRLKPLTEGEHQELRSNYGDIFEVGMGAEAILQIIKNIDLEKLYQELLEEARSTSGQRHKKANKRLRMVEAFRHSGNKPEWMILTVIPVLPPELRPIVQLDGGRFATSDLNDLYRRVINRNNRLQRLIGLGAPEIIIHNEKRMLQEAVDSLIDNGRRGQVITRGGNHRLKSLSDALRGKHGRFRQNLLGKRVDYSGRSVIVVGPSLKLHQCGLPRRMAVELFKPFVMHKLIEQGYAHNIKSARRLMERASPEISDLLEEVIKERPVLLNRAPTLHRLGIQAFEPVLIDGNAIQLHPLVCTAFNADFDGDQMAVHVPLSGTAVKEAREHMLSTHNILLPSCSEPVMVPTLDMALGCYYLTKIKPQARREKIVFASFEEAELAYEFGAIELNAEIEVRNPNGERIKTSVGRILFNDALPAELPFYNDVADKATLKRLVSDCHQLLGDICTVTMLDDLKQLGFNYAAKSGITIAMGDIEVPPTKTKLLEEADEKIAVIENQLNRGLITEDERYDSAVQIWTEATDKITETISQSLDRYGGLYMMATSGAKGNISQIRQMAGMRGMMTDPSGKIIDFPIRSSFREGLTVMEYFISTHGARKGLADTALRTSNSGYLTRRLIDVAQDVIVLEKDCGTTEGIWLREGEKGFLLTLEERLIGRLAAARIVNPQTGETIVERNEEIDEDKAKQITAAAITEVYIRSPLSCRTHRGVCQYCYGRDLARGQLVKIGTAVGIIAAESIGEPGTQLTLRTFHTGGIVGVDITSGLPRIEELFEARSPKGHAILSEIDGVAEVISNEQERKITITNVESYLDEYPLSSEMEVVVSNRDQVDIGAVLARSTLPAPTNTVEPQLPTITKEQLLLARVPGQVTIEDNRLYVKYEERDSREYITSPSVHLRVKSGTNIKAGDQLTDGSIDPKDTLRIAGREETQRYLVDEVQKVYRSQGVTISDKHIEIIIRQMLSRVRVESSGDTELLPDELVNRFSYEDINAKILAEGGEPATAQTVLLGITRASLNTDSWLAAASFQETTRVLTEASLQGKIDKLLGLKENVIIGKLIPAQALTKEEVDAKILANTQPAQLDTTQPII